MGNFDHYPDMNRDGKKDSYDSGAFHNLMDEPTTQHNNYKSSPQGPMYDIHGNRVWPAQLVTPKEEVFVYRVVAALGALATGVPAYLLYKSDLSDNTFFGLLIILLFMACIVSIKEMLFGWPR